jgi:hypothetical protein
MKVYRLSTEQFEGMMADTIDGLIELIRAELTEESTSEVGTELHIEVMFMTPQEFESLPDV